MVRSNAGMKKNDANTSTKTSNAERTPRRFSVRLSFARGTKNKYVFVSADPAHHVTDLYVAKSAFGEQIPSWIVVTVEESIGFSAPDAKA